MLPINPIPPFKGARPLLMLGLAAAATALAIWARRQVRQATRGQNLIRVEPAPRVEPIVEVPWVTEVKVSVLSSS